MNGFNRTRLDPHGPEQPLAIVFILQGKALDRLLKLPKQSLWDWKGLNKKVNYQTLPLLIAKQRSSLDEISYVIQFEVVGTGCWMWFRCKEDRNQKGLFVIDAQVRRQGPFSESDYFGLVAEVQIIDDGRRYSRSMEWNHCLNVLRGYPASFKLKSEEIEGDIRIWKKYIEAWERTVKEKTVFFQVMRPKLKDRDTLCFPLDLQMFKDVLTKRLDEAGLPYQEIQFDSQQGFIDLNENLEEEILEPIKSVLHESCFVPEQQRDLTYWQEFLLQIPRWEASKRVDYLTSLAERGGEVVSQDGKNYCFRFEGWKQVAMGIQNIVSKGADVISMGRIQGCCFIGHRFDRAEAVKQFLDAQEKALQKQFPSGEVERWGERGLRIVFKDMKGVEGWKGSQDQLTMRSSLRVRFSESESEVPLKPVRGLEIVEDGYIGENDDPEALLASYRAIAWKAAWGREASTFEVEMELSYDAVAWKSQCLKKDGQAFKLKQGRLLYQSTVIDEGAWEAALVSLQARFPGLEAGAVQVEVGVVFKEDEAQYRDQQRQQLQEAIRSKLQAKFYWEGLQKLLTSGSLDKGFALSCRLNRSQDMERVQCIVQNWVQEKGGRIARSERWVRQSFVLDRVLADKFLDGFWKDLRGRPMLFGEEKAVEGYKKAGLEGDSKMVRAGELKSLRGGEILVEIELGEVNLSQFQEGGYLVPWFRADLSQIKRLKEVVALVQKPKDGLPANSNLRTFLFKPEYAENIPLENDVRSDRQWKLKHSLNEGNLNGEQQEAVWKALAAKDMVLVQGPPGTGKTTVISEIIWQMVQEDENAKVLISSQSHLAVDNVLERLYKKNAIRPLRLASSTHASRSIEPEGRKYFEEVIHNWANAAPRSEAESQNPNTVGDWMVRVAQQVKSEDPFSEVQKRWQDCLCHPEPDQKGFFVELYLDCVNVVAATCLECGRKDFKELYGEGFDCVIIDEASKATPPEMLLPLVVGKKVVIIGDHKQLPPMVDHETLDEALRHLGADDLAQDLEYAVKTSQFEKLFEGADDSIKVTLRTQYRMHEAIMKVINPFYQEEGGLECGIRKEMDDTDVTKQGSRHHGLNLGQWLKEDLHVVWVDVQGCETRGGTSYYNADEVKAVGLVLESLVRSDAFQRLQKQLPAERREIGLISFYGKQIEHLKPVIKKFEGEASIRLRTVDKFQGMERDIVIVSTVQSAQQRQEGKKEVQKNKHIGFAKESQRINVAFSRARRLLIIVGDEDHFMSHPNYHSIREVIGRHGGRVGIQQLY